MAEFKHLFTPIQIGGITLKNRIYSTGHVPAFAEDGYPKERYRLYHAEKAKGGVGLTIFGGSTSILDNSPATEWSMIANRDESIIPYYREMADARAAVADPGAVSPRDPTRDRRAPDRGDHPRFWPGCTAQ